MHALSNNLFVRSLRLRGREKWQLPHQGLFVVFVHEGAGDYLHTNFSWNLKQGDVLVLKSTFEQNRFVAGKSVLALRYFSLSIEQIFPLFDVSELGLLEEVFEGFENPRHYPASAPVAVQCHKQLQEVPAKPGLEGRTQLMTIAARIISAELKTARTRRARFVSSEERIQQVFEELSEREFLSLSVQELASRFGCSRRHLNRLFQKCFGSTIAEFRMEVRLRKVASLLINPNSKIIHVAEQCGFNHLGHFNVCFKRRFGVSPGLWRKGVSAIGEEPPRDGRVGERVSRIFRQWAARADPMPERLAPVLSVLPAAGNQRSGRSCQCTSPASAGGQPAFPQFPAWSGFPVDREPQLLNS